ncbi:MAG: helix-turn-helix transcriptional regulator [Chthonomonadaceae bacterium]|nr:helix-turn-helix transcriptional regulator [Chthonomonadaceae bacterium]
MLSARENEVLKSAAKGLTSLETAELLGISTHSVNTYWRRIRQKVGDLNRAGLVAWYQSENSTKTKSDEPWMPVRRTVAFVKAKKREPRLKFVEPGSLPKQWDISVHPEDFPVLVQSMAEFSAGDQEFLPITYRILAQGWEIESSNLFQAVRDSDKQLEKLLVYSVDSQNRVPSGLKVLLTFVRYPDSQGLEVQDSSDIVEQIAMKSENLTRSLMKLVKKDDRKRMASLRRSVSEEGLNVVSSSATADIEGRQTPIDIKFIVDRRGPRTRTLIGGQIYANVTIKPVAARRVM